MPFLLPLVPCLPPSFLAAWDEESLHEVLSDAFSKPWGPRQLSVLASSEGVETVAQAVERVANLRGGCTCGGGCACGRVKLNGWVPVRGCVLCRAVYRCVVEEEGVHVFPF